MLRVISPRCQTYLALMGDMLIGVPNPKGKGTRQKGKDITVCHTLNTITGGFVGVWRVVMRA